MSLAYHLLAHKNPVQLERLLDAIWAPENFYVIHYDRRRPATEHRAVQALAAGRSNVVIQKPRAVLWGRFSLIQAQIEGLKTALEHGGDWTHWINLSGQCFPLQPPDSIANQLAAKAGVSFVHSFDPLATNIWTNPRQRLTCRALDLPWLEWWLWSPWLGRRLRKFFGGGPIPVLGRRQSPTPPFSRWYGGDNWVVLSRTAAEMVVSSAAAPLIKWFRNTILPEESVFQTVLQNSPEAPRIRNEHLREIFWFNNECSPHLFRREHFDRLESAARAGRLFARKFDQSVDSEILTVIEQRLLAQNSSVR